MSDRAPSPSSAPTMTRITDFWHCAQCDGMESRQTESGQWVCKGCGANTTERVEAILRQEWPDPVTLPAADSPPSPAPTLSDDADASIALTVRGLRSLTEHFGRIVNSTRGGVMLSREMAYAIQIELQDKLTALRSSASALDRIHGITFLLIHDGCVLLERCPKKREVLGIGEWFVPGGKLEPGEGELDACRREMCEELGVNLLTARPLPILEGSPVPPGPRGLFLMRPFLISEWAGHVPTQTIDGSVPLRWVPFAEALASPVPQVRMMVAAALAPAHPTEGP